MTTVPMVGDDDRILSLSGMVQHRGRMLVLRQLPPGVCEYDIGDERLLDVRVGGPRRKIQHSSASWHLVTVCGMGCRLRR